MRLVAARGTRRCAGRVQRPDDEEQTLDDLLALLRILTNLISRDFLDFSESGAALSAEVYIRPEPGQVAVADVVFFGLSIVLPLLPVQMLRVRLSLSRPAAKAHPSGSRALWGLVRAGAHAAPDTVGAVLQARGFHVRDLPGKADHPAVAAAGELDAVHPLWHAAVRPVPPHGLLACQALTGKRWVTHGWATLALAP